MNLGPHQPMVECHMATLRYQAEHARGTDRTSGRRSFQERQIAPRLRNRIGLGLVELGLHLMVRARETARPAPSAQSPFDRPQPIITRRI
jgi:hypothetical protein